MHRRTRFRGRKHTHFCEPVVRVCKIVESFVEGRGNDAYMLASARMHTPEALVGDGVVREIRQAVILGER